MSVPNNIQKLAAAGILPNYIFQCRPTTGNQHFSVPIEEAYRIVEQAKRAVQDRPRE